MEYLSLKQKYFKVNEEVENIYELLTKFKENISKIKDIEVNEAIQNLKLWNFEEDGNIKQIIEDRNHALGSLEFKHSNWKKYFMVL